MNLNTDSRMWGAMRFSANNSRARIACTCAEWTLKPALLFAPIASCRPAARDLRREAAQTSFKLLNSNRELNGAVLLERTGVVTLMLAACSPACSPALGSSFCWGGEKWSAAQEIRSEKTWRSFTSMACGLVPICAVTHSSRARSKLLKTLPQLWSSAMLLRR